MNINEEIEKKVEEFHQWKRLLNEYHLIERGDREGNIAKKWLRQSLTDIYALGREEALKEATELSEEIERREPAGSTLEWMAFKHFRNTLRSLRTKGKKV